MNQPWVYICPPFQNPLLPPYQSHPIPQGHPSAPALSALSHASNYWFDGPTTGLLIYFTYGNVRFNAILSNHPTLTFSHRVQKSVLYIYVSFPVSHIGHHYYLSKSHIYVLIYCIGVFLSDLLHSV